MTLTRFLIMLVLCLPWTGISADVPEAKGALLSNDGRRQSTAASEKWKVANDALGTLKIESSEGIGAPPASVSLNYSKPRFGYGDNEAFKLEWKPAEIFDLGKYKRFTARFTADTAQGYYSGRTILSFTDKNGVEAPFLIDKEYSNARGGKDVEMGLYSFPKGFDPNHVTLVRLLVWVPNQPHQGTISLANLAFDSLPPGKVEAARRLAWEEKQKALRDGFATHLVHSSAKVFRDTWNPHWARAAGDALHLFAGRDGTDDFQYIVCPGGEGKEPLSVVMGELKDAAGNPLGADLRLYEVGWVATLPKERVTTFEGWYPDILIPLKGGLLPLSPERVSAVWGEIKVPLEAKPGTYRGEMTMVRKDSKVVVPVVVTVNNLTIPRRPTLRTAFWLHMGDIAKRLGKPEGDFPSLEEAKPWIDIALENRVTPTWFGQNHFKVKKMDATSKYSVDAARITEFSDYVIRNGGNSVDIGGGCWFGPFLYNFPSFIFGGFPGESPEDAKLWKERAIPEHRIAILDEYLRVMKQAAVRGGWEKFAYIQPWDEPNDDARGHHLQVIIPALSKAIATNWPGLRLVNTTGLPENLEKLVTMPVPTIPVIDNPNDGGRKWSSDLRAQGKSPWFYSCVSYGITISENGIRDRLIPLHAFDGNADGYLFWGLNHHWTADPATVKMNEVPDIADMARSPFGVSELLGDGYLVYPSPGDPGVLYPSLRLKAFRSGMEDYEYASRLKNLSEKDKEATRRAKGAFGRLSKALYYEAWENPMLINGFRAEVGALIDSLEPRKGDKK